MPTVLGVDFGVSAEETYDESARTIRGSHRATYTVHADDDTQREPTILAASGVPRIGQLSPITARMACERRHAREIGPRLWHVEATFTNRMRELNQDDPPETFPVEYAWSSETLEVSLNYDAVTGNPLEYTNHQPIAAPTTLPVAVLRAKRRQTTFTATTITAFVGRTNAAPFHGANPKCALMRAIDAKQTTIDDTTFWDVEYTVAFRDPTASDPGGWGLYVIDQGSYYLDIFAGNAKTVERDDAANPLPTYLNGVDGFRSDVPVELRFNQYATADFDSLNI